MTRYSFGTAIDDDDLLVIQGIEYRMQPIGMRVMRRVLNMKQPSANGDNSEAVTEDRLNAAIEVITNSVRPDEREKLAAHIEESVPPGLLVQIMNALTTGMSDLDPTQPTSSSGGSPPTGSTSADTAQPAALTPST